MIKFEQEVCDYLCIPSIPKKEWNKKDSFKKGVAVVRLSVSGVAYAVCTFDNEADTEPRIVKTFASEPFYNIEKIFVVPNYMNTSEQDINEMDLDEESKKRAIGLAQEAKELTQQSEQDKEMEEMQNLPEFIFDEIHNIEEAKAWLKAYYTRNHMNNRIPKDEEAIKLRLLNIWSTKK